MSASPSAEILARIRCPQCASEVTDAPEGLRCHQGHLMPVADGYLDASQQPSDALTAQTLESFGYEWTTFSEIQPEDETFWSNYFRDVPLDELKGKTGLDIGCGKGRFTRFTAPYLGSLVALDGSDAVKAAVRNLSDLSNVLVVKADLRQCPFENATFDFVSCLGVLHHLADPEEGFHHIVRLLAPGGVLLLYVYSRPDRRGARSTALSAAARVRTLTRTMPHRVLRAISAPIALALYGTVVVPGALGSRLGVKRLARLPLHAYRGRPLRSLWLDTFDRLSAPVEHRYVWSELQPWFERAGLHVEAVREDAGYFIVARKPVSSVGA